MTGGTDGDYNDYPEVNRVNLTLMMILKITLKMIYCMETNSVFPAKKMKDSLSSFLPGLPGVIDTPGSQVTAVRAPAQDP